MPEDEPLDDVRQVAMAAAAAAARVIETMAREARDQASQHRVTLERSYDQQRAQQTLAGLGVRLDAPHVGERQREQQQRLDDLRAAQKWASPERLEAHHQAGEGCDSTRGPDDVDRNLVNEWKAAIKPYDSPERRTAVDQVREAAGVPAEARQVRATADLMNCTDPTKAAGQTQPASAVGRTPPAGRPRTRAVSRGR